MARALKLGEIRSQATGEVLVQMMVPRAEDDPLSLCLRILTHQLKLKSPDGRFGGGLFGGPFGYGVDFENDVFEMHYDRQDYDCTCGASEPKHAATCDQVTRRSEWISARLSFAADKKSDAEIKEEIEASVARGTPRRIAALSACMSELHFERFEEYERLHPFPVCSCGALATWKESDEHARDCERSIAERPCFTHKPSGFAVDWYKYIGRDNEIRNEGAEMTLAAIFEDCLTSFGAPALEECFKAYCTAEEETAAAMKRSMEFFMGQ